MSESAGSLELTNLKPYELAKLDAVIEVQLFLCLVFLEHFAKSMGCITYEEIKSLTYEMLESEEFYDTIRQFKKVENVFGNMGEATSTDEVEACMKKFNASKYYLKKRTQAWIESGQYRRKCKN